MTKTPADLELEQIKTGINQQTEESKLAAARRNAEELNLAAGYDQASASITQQQLSLTDEIRAIENLLRGRIQTASEDGSLIWIEPLNADNKILTESGINLVLNTCGFYLNKNTLLSNYDENTILVKMEDFATSLADALFMRYEKYFIMPTPKEVQQAIIDKMNKKAEEEVFNQELRGKQVSKQEVVRQLMGNINLDNERMKMRQQMVNDKLKLFDLLMRQVQDVVHSTYLRALFGQERRTLREHIHVTESKSLDKPIQHSGGIFGMFRKR